MAIDLFNSIDIVKTLKKGRKQKKEVLAWDNSFEKQGFIWIMRSVPGMAEEFRFHNQRKFRFDFALPDLKVAFEYEGIMRGKSRHTTITGYTKDCEKYNLAALEGWKVYRYTALNYMDVWPILEGYGLQKGENRITIIP